MLEFNKVHTKIVNNIKHAFDKSYYCDDLICELFDDKHSLSSHRSFAYCVKESYFTLSQCFNIHKNSEIERFSECFKTFIDFRDYLILFICVNHENEAKQLFKDFDEKTVYDYAD